MKVHFGAEAGYGLFLNKDEAKKMEHCYTIRNNAEDYDAVIELEASDLCNDQYDLRSVDYLDGKKHEEEDCDFVNGLFLYAKKQGCVIRNDKLETFTYSSLDEMAEEFRKDYGEYLPEDFDYVAHLCIFRGAHFC